MPLPSLHVIALLGALSLSALACSSSSAARTDKAPVENEVRAPTITIQELIVRGNQALDQRQWEQAIAAYDEALALDQQRWEVHMNRAIALTFLLRYDDAIASISNALIAGGQDKPEVYFNLGNIYQERGVYDASITAYRASLAAAGGELNVDTLLNIGAAYIYLHAYPKARQALEKAAEIAPDDPRPLHSLGLLTYSEENPEEALRIYQQVEALDPNYAPAYFNQGYIQQRLGQHAEAAAAFERYLELAPEGPYAVRARNNFNRLRSR
ncbi:hypothetical protein DL240_00135 [Lujinxingia litoralis]|uniref:Uncharacterized protein n=1 Tax=Lujinxingia litoralis TaxID=2211119 RepID=A0A328CDD8_9DELT|nr:tetratricopeptide repeat protein [Lujinxingia litoralis]RAL24653.1 hypothetical protein DL240_00135 [Lujinxingia litoralis]